MLRQDAAKIRRSGTGSGTRFCGARERAELIHHRKMQPLHEDDEYDILSVDVDPAKFSTLAATHAKWRSVAGHLFDAAERLWPDIYNGFQAHFADPSQRPSSRTVVARGSLAQHY